MRIRAGLRSSAGACLAGFAISAIVGSAAIAGTRARLTSGALNQTGSVFSTNQVDVTRFSTQFTFQLTSGNLTADGFTFAIQGVSPTALGGGGGGLGYGFDRSSGKPGITKSVALKFDVYDNQGEGFNSTGLYLNGAAPTSAAYPP